MKSEKNYKKNNILSVLGITIIAGILVIIYINYAEKDNFVSSTGISSSSSNCKNITMNDMPIYAPLSNLSSSADINILLPENVFITGYSPQLATTIPETGKENLRENGSLLFVNNSDRAKNDILTSQYLYSHRIKN
jgi:hypothetical protein